MANMAERTDAGVRWWDDQHGQPTGPGEQWEGLKSRDAQGERKPWTARAHFSHHVVPWAKRARTYHHCKVHA